MSDNHDCDLIDVATEIIVWQRVAQHNSLPEVNDLAVDWLDSLGQILNEFNTTVRNYLDQDSDQDNDALARAISKVARHATAAAIFTLGLNHRVQLGLTAQTN